jgi:hypothetical protein
MRPYPSYRYIRIEFCQGDTVVHPPILEFCRNQGSCTMQLSERYATRGWPPCQPAADIPASAVSWDQMREKDPITVEMGRRAWSKRSKESLAELERRRAVGYAKVTLEDRKRAGRKAAISRRRGVIPLPVDPTQPAAQKRQENPSLETPDLDQLRRMLDSFTDDDLVLLASTVNRKDSSE